MLRRCHRLDYVARVAWMVITEKSYEAPVFFVGSEKTSRRFIVGNDKLRHAVGCPMDVVRLKKFAIDIETKSTRMLFLVSDIRTRARGHADTSCGNLEPAPRPISELNGAHAAV